MVAAALDSEGTTAATSFLNQTLYDPSWYHRKLYKTPHSAVFQVPCNDQIRRLCDTYSMGLAEPKHCECNFDSVVSEEEEIPGVS
jgi:hypothetical protein